MQKQAVFRSAALFTSTSTAPHLLTAAFTIKSTSAAILTSARDGAASPPFRTISALQQQRHVRGLESSP
jgi:hypothetical protein